MGSRNEDRAGGARRLAATGMCAETGSPRSPPQRTHVVVRVSPAASADGTPSTWGAATGHALACEEYRYRCPLPPCCPPSTHPRPWGSPSRRSQTGGRRAVARPTAALASASFATPSRTLPRSSRSVASLPAWQRDRRRSRDDGPSPGLAEGQRSGAPLRPLSRLCRTSRLGLTARVCANHARALRDLRSSRRPPARGKACRVADRGWACCEPCAVGHSQPI